MNWFVESKCKNILPKKFGLRVCIFFTCMHAAGCGFCHAADEHTINMHLNSGYPISVHS